MDLNKHFIAIPLPSNLEMCDWGDWEQHAEIDSELSTSLNVDGSNFLVVKVRDEKYILEELAKAIKWVHEE